MNEAILLQFFLVALLLSGSMITIGLFFSAKFSNARNRTLVILSVALSALAAVCYFRFRGQPGAEFLSGHWLIADKFQNSLLLSFYADDRSLIEWVILSFLSLQISLNVRTAGMGQGLLGAGVLFASFSGNPLTTALGIVFVFVGLTLIKPLEIYAQSSDKGVAIDWISGRTFALILLMLASLVLTSDHFQWLSPDFGDRSRLGVGFWLLGLLALSGVIPFSSRLFRSNSRNVDSNLVRERSLGVAVAILPLRRFTAVIQSTPEYEILFWSVLGFGGVLLLSLFLDQRRKKWSEPFQSFVILLSVLLSAVLGADTLSSVLRIFVLILGCGGILSHQIFRDAGPWIYRTVVGAGLVTIAAFTVSITPTRLAAFVGVVIAGAFAMTTGISLDVNEAESSLEEKSDRRAWLVLGLLFALQLAQFGFIDVEELQKNLSVDFFWLTLAIPVIGGLFWLMRLKWVLPANPPALLAEGWYVVRLHGFVLRRFTELGRGLSLFAGQISRAVSFLMDRASGETGRLIGSLELAFRKGAGWAAVQSMQCLSGGFEKLQGGQIQDYILFGILTLLAVLITFWTSAG